MPTHTSQTVLFDPPARTPLPVLQRRGGAVFLDLPSARIAAPGTGVMRDALTVNPYVGCELGCAYCYAPYAHGWLVERLEGEGRLREGDARAFDRAVFVKRPAEDAVAAVRRNPGRTVVLGTATDPYQPAERRFRRTRAVLEALATVDGVEASITTKSPLVLRDLDLLRRIAGRGRLTVNLSLTSLDRRVLRRLEPRAPTPSRRLETLRRLRDAGIRAGVFAMPLLPRITDGDDAVDALFAAARDADACWVVAGGVRLSGVAWRRFVPVLRAVRPDLEPFYRSVVRRRGSPAETELRRALRERIAAARARHGFDAGFADDDDDGADEGSRRMSASELARDENAQLALL